MTNNRETDLENQLAQKAELLDGGDVFGILCMIADSQNEFIEDFLSSNLALDIIKYTQSDPEMAQEVLMEMAMIDQEISEL